MFSYSTSIMLVWQIAATETLHSEFQFIEKEHLLIGLLKISDILDEDVRKKSTLDIQSTDLEILSHEIYPLDYVYSTLKIDRIGFRRLIRKLNGNGHYKNRDNIVHRSDHSRRCFKRAEGIAQVERSLTLRPIHLLEALIQEPGEIIRKVLVEHGITPEDILTVCKHSKDSDKETVGINGAKRSKNLSSKNDFLLKFGEDLTSLAKDGRIDFCIGRQDEILKIIHTLSRKTKNNPVLIGDAGIGKTAIVKGLALKIALGDITPTLRDKRIIEINMGALLAGTKYRGDFEDRIIKMIDECRNHEDIILFIDEIHTLMGTGRAHGSIDAADILKPALSKGDVTCIGSTTIEEYRKYIEKDPALERRFQPIIIEEPSELETIEIINGLKNNFEDHHKVSISPSVIEAAVKLSVRYIQDRHLPDKAIDIIDEACTRVKVASQDKNQDCEQLNSEIGRVTEDVVTKVIADWSGCPVEKLNITERDKLLSMEGELKKRIIGQDDAINKVVRLIKIVRAELHDPNKPLGVLLFIGPTGVGKTELAKALATFLFEAENSIIRLDMSEYMEKHSVAKLIGSPPGYIGYDDEGQLTGKLRRRPYSVVLLDEIEKAHPEVLDIFLQLFDEGRITDNKGRTVDAKNSIFIMTSNIGTSYTKKLTPGFGRHDEDHNEGECIAKLKKSFRPEFLNRIDEIITFRSLNLEDVMKIADILLSKLKERLINQGITLEISVNAMTLLAKNGYDSILGVRPLSRAIDDIITTPLSEMIINGKLNLQETVVVNVIDDKLMFDIK